MQTASHNIIFKHHARTFCLEMQALILVTLFFALLAYVSCNDLSAKNDPYEILYNSERTAVVFRPSGISSLKHSSNVCKKNNIVKAVCFDIELESCYCVFERHNTNIGALYHIEVHGATPTLYACDEPFDSDELLGATLLAEVTHYFTMACIVIIVIFFTVIVLFTKKREVDIFFKRTFCCKN